MGVGSPDLVLAVGLNSYALNMGFRGKVRHVLSRGGQQLPFGQISRLFGQYGQLFTYFCHIFLI